MHFAMTSAASSLMDSKKSVELCQAYLILSVWPLPSRKYDEDRAWLYLGLAIRMAMDLNLHMPTNADIVSEHQEREILVSPPRPFLLHLPLTFPPEPNSHLDHLLQHGSFLLSPTRKTHDDP